MAEAVGLRELRQQASNLVRRAEAGETITITVNGRPSAQLVPVRRKTWRPFQEIEALFTGPADPQWGADVAKLDGSVPERFS